MNRIDRLTAILIQLQTKRWITSGEIARRFEISQRTVYRDIRALEEAGIPIGAEAGKGYFIVDGYHLPPVMFTLEEAGAMLIAEKLVGKFTDDLVHKSFISATDKIKSILPSEAKELLASMNSKVEVFFANAHTGGEFPNNFLTGIQQALRENKYLLIDYLAGYSQERTCGRKIDPLGLVFYGNAWHLIGYCSLRNEMRDFRLDRIMHLQVIDETAREKKPGELTDYFRDYWRNEELYEVKVWFRKSMAGSVISSKYYFGYIGEYPDDDGVVMSFAVNDFDYIARWLIAFGDQIRIVYPDKLKELMTALVKDLTKVYLK
jgi:predicted DNA-binding transcriptional regulator YafY